MIILSYLDALIGGRFLMNFHNFFGIKQLNERNWLLLIIKIMFSTSLKLDLGFYNNYLGIKFSKTYRNKWASPFGHGYLNVAVCARRHLGLKIFRRQKKKNKQQLDNYKL